MIARRLFALLSALLLAAPAFAQTGTLLPVPQQMFQTSTGAPCANCKVYFYESGTTTLLDTYSDSDLALAHVNPNPITLNSVGIPTVGGVRVAVYLQPKSYKIKLTTSAGAVIYTQDEIPAVPPFFVDLDVQGSAGEDIVAGDVVYLSAGDGGRFAGLWYKADADATYSSSTAGVIGVAPAAITWGGAPGAIRLQGRITGLSGLSIGSKYYVSATAGALTATAPTQAREVGSADSTTSLIVVQNPSGIYKEGTFTPSLGGNATYTGTPSGNYTKIGRLVFARGDLTVATLGTGSVSTISGLPFVSSQNTVAATVYFTNAAGNFVYVGGYINTGTSTLKIFGLGAAGASVTDPATFFANGTVISFAITYTAY